MVGSVMIFLVFFNKFATITSTISNVVWWKELKKVDILKSKIERFINESHI